MKPLQIMPIASACLAAALIPLPAYAACTDAPNNAEMTMCLDKELQAIDARLNAVYKKVNASLGEDAPAKASLLKSERAWIAYKEAQCNEVVGGQWAGGTGQGAAISSCTIALTRNRIKELEDVMR